MKKRLSLIAAVLAVLSVTPAHADRIVKTISVGGYLSCGCVNPVTNYIYAGGNSAVSRINGNTCAALPSAAVKGTYILDVACDPVANKVYAISSDSAYISVITEGRIVGVTNIKIAYSVYGGHIAVGQPLNRVFVTSPEHDSLIVLDMTTNAVSYINLGYTSNLIAVNPSTGMVYAASYSNNRLCVINGSALTLTTTITVGSEPWAVAVNPVTNRIYVANSNGNSVSVINGANNTVLKTVTVSGANYLAVNPATNKIFIGGTNAIYVLDEATSILSHLSLPAGLNPYKIIVDATTNKVYTASDGATTSDDTGYVVSADINASHLDTLHIVYSSYPGELTPIINPITNRLYVICNNLGNATVIDAASDSCRAIAAGTGPYDIAVNPVTNKIYTCNDAGTVSVLDGATETVTGVTVGTTPEAVAVNPVSGKIYTANYGAGTVSVITGTTVTKTITVGSNPLDIGVNPVTNKIYVVNYTGGTVSVIDGGHDTVIGTRTVGTHPERVAVNSVTNRVFVSNYVSNTVSVLDESLGIVDTTVSVAAGPCGIAINSITNKAYVACYTGNCVKVINGSTYAVSATIATGTGPWAVALNQNTFNVYTANLGGNSVTIIDGGTDASLGSVAVCASPYRVAVNPLTNMAYVVGTGSNYLSVIDGATNTVVNRSALLSAAQSLAVNPVTNRVYVANRNGNNIVVLDAVIEQATGVSAQWQPAFAHPYTTDVFPVITGYAKNAWSPNPTLVHNIGNTTGSWGTWDWATTPGNSDSVSWTFGWSVGLRYGENFVSIVPFETQLATTNNLGAGATFAGNVLCSPLYLLENVPPTTVWWDSLPDDTASPYGTYTVNARIDDQSNIYTVALKYSYGGVSYSTIAMTKVGIDTFSAVIPGTTLAVGDSTRLYYYLQPYDFSYLLNDTVTATRSMKLRNGANAVRQLSSPAIPLTFGLECGASKVGSSCQTIRYQLPVLSDVKITILDAAGRQLQLLDEGARRSGHYAVTWNAARAGVYFCRMQAGSFTATRKIVVVR
jgi:YVTN family beta-propeller protein